MAKKLISDRARFFQKIIKNADGCWIWQLSKDRDGYGMFRVGRASDGSRRQVRVHRWSYEEFIGPIPHGLQIDHLCRVRNCVNPDHLDIVTILENTQRGSRHTKLYCKNGHPLFGKNLKIIPRTGYRACRICQRESTRAHYRKTNGAAQKKYAKLNLEKRRLDSARRRKNWTPEQRERQKQWQKEYDATRRHR